MRAISEMRNVQHASKRDVRKEVLFFGRILPIVASVERILGDQSGKNEKMRRSIPLPLNDFAGTILPGEPGAWSPNFQADVTRIPNGVSIIVTGENYGVGVSLRGEKFSAYEQLPGKLPTPLFNNLPVWQRGDAILDLAETLTFVINQTKSQTSTRRSK